MKSQGTGREKEMDHTDLVTIPIFQHLVLAHGPEVMGSFLESNLHDTLLMGKYRFVAVSEIKPPDFYVLVRRAGHN